MFVLLNKTIILSLINAIFILHSAQAMDHREKKYLQRQAVKQAQYKREKAIIESKAFQFCPTMNIRDPRAQVFLGLLIVSTGIIVYQNLPSGQTGFLKNVTYEDDSRSVLKWSSNQEPIVTFGTLHFHNQQRSNSIKSIPCETKARDLAKKQGGRFPSYVTNVPRPGLYVSKDSKVVLLDRPYTDYSRLVEWEEIQGHKNFQKAIEYTENLSNLMFLSNENFKNILLEINAKVSGVFTGFRDRPVMIRNPNMPMIHDVKKIEAHFRNSPPDLNLYRELRDIMDHELTYPELQQLDVLAAWGAVLGSIFRSDHPSYKRIKPFCQKFYTYNGLTPPQISQSYDKLWESVQAVVSKDPIRAAAQLHMGIVEIHGFLDGNGRPARLMAQKLLKDHGYPAFPFLSENKYSVAVYQSMKRKSIDPFETYLKDQICQATSLEFKNGEELEHIAETCSEQCESELNDAVNHFNM